MTSRKEAIEEKSALIWIGLSALIVALDQASKWLAESHLNLGESVAVVPHLNWALAYNTGAAFSFLSNDGGWQRWFLVSLSLMASVYLFYWLKHVPRQCRVMGFCLSLILGGAVGNLIDRVVYGKVIDFIDFYADVQWPFLMPYGHFATFNIADVAVSVGAVSLIVLGLLRPEQLERRISNANNQQQN